jgi:prolyl-tRNA synthetase
LSSVQIVDAHNVVEGDPAPNGQGELKFLRGIEVGHIFQLGSIYSEAMNAGVLDHEGQTLTPLMGCYGMGVTRLVAAIIEQNYDDNGILWPEPIAPFNLHIIALNYHKSADVQKAADDLYAACQKQGIEVLIDDRDERPGIKFADADLIGLPRRIVIGDRGLKNGVAEFKQRTDESSVNIPLDKVMEHLTG